MLSSIETVVKKNEIYRRKAKKKAIKILTNKKRKVNDVQDNFSDAEIPYTKPYRDTFTKKDKIYRKKSKESSNKNVD